jgi:hypothetical protein
MVRKDAYGLYFILALHALAIFSSDFVFEAAEIDEVATGERPARLLQAATGRETAKHSRRFSEFVLDNSSHENLQRVEARIGSIT